MQKLNNLLKYVNMHTTCEYTWDGGTVGTIE